MKDTNRRTTRLSQASPEPTASPDTILNKYVSNYNLDVLEFRQSGQQEVIRLINKTYVKRSEVQKIRQGYDPNRLGSWVFIGDNARLENLDDLYWSYVMEVVAEHDPYSVQNGNYSLDYIKKNMKSASFGSVGIHKILARADQRAKERLKSAQTLATTLTRSDVVGMLPEKINDWLDDNNYEMQENASKWRVEGYNQAIDDMRNALGEGHE